MFWRDSAQQGRKVNPDKFGDPNMALRNHIYKEQEAQRQS